MIQFMMCYCSCYLSFIAYSVGHTNCHTTHHQSHPPSPIARTMLRPLSPVPWSHLSLPTPCIVPLITHAMVIAQALHCPYCVSRYLLPVSCVTPITRAIVVHLVMCTMCHTSCHTHRASHPLPVCHGCAPCRVCHMLRPSPVPWL